MAQFFEMVSASFLALGLFSGFCVIVKHHYERKLEAMALRVKNDTAYQINAMIDRIRDRTHQEAARRNLKSAIERNHAGDISEVVEKISQYLEKQETQQKQNQGEPHADKSNS